LIQRGKAGDGDSCADEAGRSNFVVVFQGVEFVVV